MSDLPKGFRVKKKKWSKLKDGRRISGETEKYYVFFTDADGKERQEPAFDSYDRSADLARKLFREREAVKAGAAPNTSALAERMTLPEWVDAFETHLRSGDCGDRHAEELLRRLRRLLAGRAAVADLTPEHVAAFLAGLKRDGKSAQTRKHYLRAVRQFTRWLVKRKAIPACPLGDVETPQVKRDRRHVRRAASREELSALYASVRARRKTYRGLPAADRIWLYVIATLTGYRAGELAVLLPSDFRLDGEEPAVVLPGKYTKNGDPTAQPLDPAQVPAIRDWLATRPPRKPVWPGTWHSGKAAARMLRLDLEHARAAWVAAAEDASEREQREQSDFLAYRDHRGRFFDVHSLRVTYITMLARAGLPNAVVQKLARHSSWELTAQVYIDNGLSQLAQSVRGINIPSMPL